MKYWHRLSKKEVDGIHASEMTVGELVKQYKQPTWCGYPEALSGMMGCWSLMSDKIRPKISNKFCASCECYTKIKK